MHANPDVIEIDDAAMPCASRFAWPDDGLSAFLCARPRLFGIAYRMLGSAAEAEDIVQDVWVRWQTTDRSPVRNPLAFLVTATTRLAINVLQSARARRETAAGPSLPEPVDTSTDPGLGAERGEALNLAVLLLLEKLSPTERAAYVLREAFNHPYREIARHPSGRRSQRAAARHESAGACVGRTARTRESGRAAAPAQCVRGRVRGRVISRGSRVCSPADVRYS